MTSDAVTHLANCEKEELQVAIEVVQWRLETIKLQEEIKVMQTILSLPDLRPGQEKIWIRMVQDPLDTYVTVNDRRALVLLLCHLEKHPETTAMAANILRCFPYRGVATFVNWLNSWAEERKLSKHSPTQSQKLLEPLSGQGRPTCIVKPFRH